MSDLKKCCINENSIRYLQNIFIFIFISIAFYFTIQSSYYSFQTHHAYQIGDWLINYQGGFVRRGFLGEMILSLSNNFLINPGLIVHVIHVLLYFIFMLFTYLSLIKQKNIEQFFLLIFSPYVFYFQVLDIPGGCRKDILFLAFLSFTVWIALKFKNDKFNIIFKFGLLFYPFVILTHEMFAIYMPYVLAIYFIKNPFNKTTLKSIMFYAFPSIVAFVISVLFKGDMETALSIYKSLLETGYAPYPDAIAWLAKDTSEAVNLTNEKMLQYDYFKKYGTVFIISLIAFIPVIYKIRQLWKISPSAILFFLGSWIGTLFLAYVAYDWGRFLYLHLVSVFLVLLTLNKFSLPNFRLNISRSFMIFLSILYFSFWNIPHCCYFESYRGFNLFDSNVMMLIKSF